MTFASISTPGQQLANQLRELITQAGIWSPRGKQIAIGPSEIGHECSRRLAYKLLDWEKPNESGSSSWAAQVGSAIHNYLAEVFGKLEGYEVEQKVQIRANLSGTIDLYDSVRGLVLDWKTTGFNQLKERRSAGATIQQQVQIQLYGYGKAQMGAPVNKVGLVYLPVSGSLDDMHVELFDYDESVAIKALSRIDDLYTLLSTVDVEQNPQMLTVIPAAASRNCNWCPYFIPFSKDLAKGCNGDTIVDS
jgi:hypothetical protein